MELMNVFLDVGRNPSTKGDSMNDITELEIAYACERLTVQYCQLIDHGQAARTADLFSPNGVLDLGRGEWRGREAIRDGMKARDAMTQRISRHVCNNFLITSMENSRATATTYLSLYRSVVEAGEEVGRIDGPAVLGEYEDRFIKTDEGWRIAHRICRIDLTSED